MLRSNHRLILCVELIGLALIAAPIARAQLQGPSALGQSSTVSFTVQDNITSSDPDLVTNSCNGEIVSLTGILTLSYHQETHPNGDQHIVWDTRGTLTGVGLTTGAQYKYQDSMHSDLKVDPSINLNQQARQNYTETDRYHLVSQTRGVPDLYEQQKIHWQINSQGVLITRDPPEIIRCTP